MNPAPHTVGQNTPQAYMSEIADNTAIEMFPVIDEAGRVANIIALLARMPMSRQARRWAEVCPSGPGH